MESFIITYNNWKKYSYTNLLNFVILNYMMHFHVTFISYLDIIYNYISFDMLEVHRACQW